MMNKLAVALFLSAAAVAVNGQPGQPEAGNPPCYICGDENQRVTEPEFVVEVPGQVARTCMEVEEAGLAGLITEAQCGFLPGIFAVPCGCEEVEETDEPVPVNPIEPVPENLPETDEPDETVAASDVPSDMPSLMPSGAPSVMTGEGGTDAPGTDAPSASMTVAGSAGAVAMAAAVAVFMM